MHPSESDHLALSWGSCHNNRQNSWQNQPEFAAPPADMDSNPDRKPYWAVRASGPDSLGLAPADALLSPFRGTPVHERQTFPPAPPKTTNCSSLRKTVCVAVICCGGCSGDDPAVTWTEISDSGYYGCCGAIPVPNCENVAVVLRAGEMGSSMMFVSPGLCVRAPSIVPPPHHGHDWTNPFPISVCVFGFSFAARRSRPNNVPVVARPMVSPTDSAMATGSCHRVCPPNP